jgi:hypothetical protein
LPSYRHLAGGGHARGAAFDLIKIIEMEKSGIRDAGGVWYGGDPLGGIVREIVLILDNIRNFENDRPQIIDGGKKD